MKTFIIFLVVLLISIHAQAKEREPRLIILDAEITSKAFHCYYYASWSRQELKDQFLQIGITHGRLFKDNWQKLGIKKLSELPYVELKGSLIIYEDTQFSLGRFHAEVEQMVRNEIDFELREQGSVGYEKAKRQFASERYRSLGCENLL